MTNPAFLQRMGYLALFFLMSFVAISQNPGMVVITGEIKDPNADLGEWLLVKAFIHDFAGESTRIESEFINDDKTFVLTFEMDRPQDITFSCGKYLRQIYVQPGDSLYIIVQSEQETPLKVIYGGDEQMNLHIDAFVVRQQYKFGYFGVPDSLTKLSPEAFKSLKLKHMEARLADLTEFLQEHNIQYLLFQNWAKHYIHYGIAKDLLFYAMYKSMKNRSFDVEKEVSTSYFDFLLQIPVSNNEAADNSNYASYLNDYCIAFPSKSAKPYYQVEPDHPIDSLPKAMIQSVNYYASGFARDVMLTMSFTNLLNSPKASKYFQAQINLYFELVQDAALRKKVFQLYNTIKNGTKTPLTKELNTLQFPDSVKNILPAILEKHKGKVIVLDFWGTWCAPCLAELERLYPVLVPKFDPEKVAFVFLANSSIKGIWEKKVSEFKFTGDHYFLNAGQSAVMSEIFSVSALPHHAIIDAEGNIVEKKLAEITVEIISKYQ